MDNFKHGTDTGYSYHKCRCEDCVAFKHARDKAYYERNREKVKAANKAWRQANSEKANEWQRQDRALHPEKRRARDKANYRKNPERHYEKQRAWNDKNPWRLWFYGWKRRERERGEIYDEATLEWIKTLKDPTCTYCGAAAETIDHIIPRSKGGTNDRANLTPSCHKCNRMKCAMDVDAFIARRTRRNGNGGDA